MRVIAVGEVDLATAPVLEDCLLELAEVGFEWLVLDLDRISFMDCAGLRLLVGAWSRAARSGARLDVVHAHGQVGRLLALSLEQPPTPGWTTRLSGAEGLTELTAGVGGDADANPPSLTAVANGPGREYELPTANGRRL